MIHYLMLSIFVSWIGSSWSQTTIMRDAVPDSYLILSSNQYNDEVDCVQDPLCQRTAGTSENGEGCGEAETLLTCAGPSTRLFDEDAGNNVPNDPEDNDLLQYYTWQQGLTPSPYIAMIFNQPLVELPNITMYFYHERRLDVRLPFLSMCFSRSLTYTPCINIDLPERPDRLNNGVLEWPVTLLTNATSVTYLRVDMQYENVDSDQFIFLSEIRVAERLLVQTLTPTPSSTATSSAIADETPANTGPTNMLSHSTMIVNDTGRTTTSDNDDDSVNVAVISGAVIGISLLIIVIFVMVIMMMILCSRRRKESRRSYNIDDNNVTVKLSSHAPNTQQHTSNTSGAKVDPTSKLETVNALYIPTEVKSLNSLLQHHDVIGSDVIITPNPSYSVAPNSSDTAKNCEYHQYDYVQTNDGLVECDKVVGSTTSGGVYNEITDCADNVNIDPNPSYSLAQDIKLEDNPSYDMLLL